MYFKAAVTQMWGVGVRTALRQLCRGEHPEIDRENYSQGIQHYVMGTKKPSTNDVGTTG